MPKTPDKSSDTTQIMRPDRVATLADLLRVQRELVQRINEIIDAVDEMRELIVERLP